MISEIFVGQSSVCDFCDSEMVVVVFYCPDFIVSEAGGIKQHSIGDWMACHECANLVYESDKTKLVDSSVRSYENRRGIAYTQEEREAVGIYMDEIIEGFLSHYTGSDLIDEA